MLPFAVRFGSTKASVLVAVREWEMLRSQDGIALTKFYFAFWPHSVSINPILVFVESSHYNNDLTCFDT